VHAGSAANLQTLTTAVDSIRHEDTDQDSVRAESVDSDSVQVDSVSATARPVFSIMPEEARPVSAKTVRLQKISKPPGFDIDLSERGIYSVLCYFFALYYGKLYFKKKKIY